jgi:PAT family beta-lactamase induction signal transducer AmpG
MTEISALECHKPGKFLLNKSMILVLLLGFSSGLPLLLVYSTLSARLVESGINRSTIGLFLLVQLPYNFKFLWSPILDSIPPPFLLGQRRGWGITIQILLIISVICLGSIEPSSHVIWTALAALVVSFFSASQDIVIDAWRIESLESKQQGLGSAFTTAGYRIAMLVAGAGSLIVADYWNWFYAYFGVALLILIGIVAFLLADEPPGRPIHKTIERDKRKAIYDWFQKWVFDSFLDFIKRPSWGLILIFIASYKLGEAMAGSMAMPLYLSLGFSKSEIAEISKFFGFFATLLGGFLGGWIITRLPIIKALLLCGFLQSFGNIFYVIQVNAGHHIGSLALCVVVENLTSGMAGVALIAYLAGLCRMPFTATQYALLSSIALLGRNLVAASGGYLSERLGWNWFFIATTLITIPSLILLLWLENKGHKK